MGSLKKVFSFKTVNDIKRSINKLSGNLLKEYNFKSVEDFNNKYKDFNISKESNLKSLDSAEASNKDFLKSLYDAKNTVKIINHKYAVYHYQSEVACAKSLDTKTTENILKLKDIEGKFLKHNELINYNGANLSLVESVLKGIEKATKILERDKGIER